jgi:CelD/BcsL family acetyltransferase involved in cellulose biosynthesis
VELSLASFRARKDISAFEDESYRGFFRDILVGFETRGRLDAHKLVAGSHTLAVSFGYRYGSGFKWILTAYNSEFSVLRPGHILLDFLIQDSIARGDLRFDMYYGGEIFYKQQWCNKMEPLKQIGIYRRNPFNKAVIGVEKKFRSNKMLLGIARKSRDMFYRIKFGH